MKGKGDFARHDIYRSKVHPPMRAQHSRTNDTDQTYCCLRVSFVDTASLQVSTHLSEEGDKCLSNRKAEHELGSDDKDLERGMIMRIRREIQLKR